MAKNSNGNKIDTGEAEFQILKLLWKISQTK